MVKRLFSLLIAAVVGVTLIGCETTTKEDTGKVVGGVLGGVLGSQVGSGSGQTAATIVGAIAGVYIGGSIGKSMDDTDRLKAQHALEHNPTHHPSTWQNPDSGRQYTVTPTRTYTASTGEPCREFTTEAYIDGKPETVYGTACRQPDGTWKAVN